MHELAVTQEILSIVLAEAESNGAKRINKVRVKVGEMTAVVGDCVCFYFDIISRGTIAEGAGVEIENIPIEARCSACGKVYRASELDFLCPFCGGIGSLISGRELLVEEIEIDRSGEGSGNKGP
jgi:hydrogenase nickel incorporation protein HypA/HybF